MATGSCCEEKVSTMSKSRRAYPLAFREQMVELVRSARSRVELAREFELTRECIGRWVRLAAERTGGLRSDEREEMRRLCQENLRLGEERNILAKAAAWLARETGPGRSTGS